ncbi:MAG: formimidoylglutamate deiminase [Candidatus Competibacterales bacterium]
MADTTTIWAEGALLADGWRPAVRLTVDGAGVIAAVEAGVAPRRDDVTLGGQRLLPAPVNVHSHAFQRAMAGMTEVRTGPDDDFWTWRQLMYAFLEHLDPDHIRAIAAMAQLEMLEAGFAACGEFHYLHHGPGGQPYADLAAMAGSIVEAAKLTGIGLTLLPVLYCRGGVDNSPLTAGQRRFGNDLEGFAKLLEASEARLAELPGDSRLGLAPHSLRAVAMADIEAAVALRPQGPIHIHVAEQMAEVAAIVGDSGLRPVMRLCNDIAVDERWCLIHATHMVPAETRAVARSGCVVGLCPLTEANLGDGVFDAPRHREAKGRIAVGSDSNISISLADELRTLEYAQRLNRRRRVVYCDENASVGRTLLGACAAGGAQAAGRDAGALAPGKLADVLSLDLTHPSFAGLDGDALLDTWIFAAPGGCVRHVWSAGRWVVKDGRHGRRDEIAAGFRTAMADLRRRGL